MSFLGINIPLDRWHETMFASGIALIGGGHWTADPWFKFLLFSLGTSVLLFGAAEWRHAKTRTRLGSSTHSDPLASRLELAAFVVLAVFVVGLIAHGAKLILH